MQIISKYKVPFSTLLRKALPQDIIDLINEAMAEGYEFAYVMSVLDEIGYKIVITPFDAEVEVESPEDEMDEFMEPPVEKGYSFEYENWMISRNKKRVSASASHDFRAARFATRDGRVRCLMCGGLQPENGVCKDGEVSVDGPDVNSVHVPTVQWGSKPRKRPSDASVGSVSMNAHVFKSDGERCATCGEQADDMQHQVANKMLKAAEKRFTLGPMYIPDMTDAHGEWTDGEELQNAIWDYVRLGDRRIRLQHNTDIVAGEWLEIMSWPYPVTVPMFGANGEIVSREFPSDTVFLGVQWDEWAWELVKQGKVSGYSIGGKAQRVLVDMPEAE